MRTRQVFIIASLAAACARDPLPEACPDLAAGDLVISEIRGPQSGGTDTLGQWIEIYNASGHVVDLQGLTLRMQHLDGSGDVSILVRAEREVGIAGYATLGRFAAGSEPAYVTYGFLDDFSSNLYSSGAVDVRACEALIDRTSYRSLPTAGTLALDGTGDPDATDNDDAASWCTDASGVNHPGTPQERNPPCGQ